MSSSKPCLDRRHHHRHDYMEYNSSSSYMYIHDQWYCGLGAYLKLFEKVKSTGSTIDMYRFLFDWGLHIYQSKRSYQCFISDGYEGDGMWCVCCFERPQNCVLYVVRHFFT